jgi:HK97 family phage prohead protease
MADDTSLWSDAARAAAEIAHGDHDTALVDEAQSRPRATDELRTARDDMRGCRETRRMPVTGFELREVPNGSGGSNLLFTGYASVTCADHDDESHTYEMEDWLGPWTESIVRGAFQKTIGDNADVAFLLNHGGVTMARTKPGTLKLNEDLTGLYVEATLNPQRSDVQILRAAIDDGALDEMSFAFRVTRQEWNEDYDRRWITEVNLDKGDVSPVNYGANPHTGGLVTMRSAVALMATRGLTRETFVASLVELRAGKTISQATMDALQPIHDYLTDGVEHDNTLAELLDIDTDEDEQENSPGPASITDLLLPDHTTSAKQKLAALRAA